MDRPSLYIAGPMSGIPGSNYAAFLWAEHNLRAAGYTRIVNPARTLLPSDSTWDQFMRDGLTGLLRCEAVALLPGWQASRGAVIECCLAERLGFDVRPIDGWLS